MTLKNYI